MKSVISFSLFLFLSFLAFLTGKAVLYALMVMALLVVLVNVQYCIWMSRKIRTRFFFPTEHPTKEEPFFLQVEVHNKSRLPISKLQVELCVEDYFSKEKIGLRASTFLASQSHSILSFSLKQSYYSKLDVSIESLELFDLFHLLSWKIKTSEEKNTIYVLPGNQEQTLSLTKGEVPSKDPTTSNPSMHKVMLSDMYELKEFEAGDSLKQIHWKLSAKSDDLIVRDYVGSNTSQVLVILNPLKEKECTRLEWDAFILRVSEIVTSLLEKKIDVRVEWLKNHQRHVHSIENKEDIYIMLRDCLGCLQKGEMGFDPWENREQEILVQEIIEINLLEVAYTSRRM